MRRWLCDLLAIFAAATAVKIALVTGYRSTDFEVHRNWLAITYSKPVTEWYFEETSQWTLDYPPLFAYFEWALSQIAVKFDPKMVQISATEYASNATVWFQKALFVGIAVLLNPALLLVDHVHFQYNGFIIGWFLLALAALRQGWYCTTALLFTALVLLKHLFLVFAPFFAFALLREYCFAPALVADGGIPWRRVIGRVAALVAIALTVLGAAMSPFLLSENPTEQVHQIIRRLFPWERGLCHIYWAPNAWPMYLSLDKGLGRLVRWIGEVPETGVMSRWFNATYQSVRATGGQARSLQTLLLPALRPWTTIALQCGAMVPVLGGLVWRRRHHRRLSRSHWVLFAVYCSLSSFLFGWHVHEKAILVALVPFLVTLPEHKMTYTAWWLSFIASATIAPILHTPMDKPLSFLFGLTHAAALWLLIEHEEYFYRAVFPDLAEQLFPREEMEEETENETREQHWPTTWSVRLTYGCGLLAAWCFWMVAPIFLWDRERRMQRLEFLPLLLISLVGSIGLTFLWLTLGRSLLPPFGNESHAKLA